MRQELALYFLSSLHLRTTRSSQQCATFKFKRKLLLFLQCSKFYFYFFLVWGRGEVCTGFWWGSPRERDHWGDPDVDGMIILRWIFRKWEEVVGTGWSGLRIGTGGGHL
jgi:hypothetical protein